MKGETVENLMVYSETLKKDNNIQSFDPFNSDYMMIGIKFK